MEPRSDEQLINQAAQWYARLRAPDCSPAERRAFQAWVTSDVAHGQAYKTAVRTADLISSQLTIDPRLRSLAAAALDKPAHTRSEAFKNACHKHWRHAAVLVFSAGMAAFLAARMGEQRPDATPMASYANNEMREQRIELDDGSILHLDVGAEVTVVMSAEARRLELTKGRAYFEVAHDRSRPFSVAAAGTRTVALGTRFEVELLSQAVNVTLAEGSVAITDAGGSDRWREVLSPGQQLQVDPLRDRRTKVAVNAEALTGWSRGHLVFDGMPLHKVLDEINRYATVKVHLGDGELANIPIGGNFVAGGDSGEFVETLAAVLPLRSIRIGTNEIVLFQRYETRTP